MWDFYETNDANTLVMIPGDDDDAPALFRPYT
jgi:hypothetical protein